MIELVDVYKAYGEKAVLCGFSTVFQEGAVNFLVGASGAGKTTILRLLMGLESPDGGQVVCEGRIGAVFQENRLFENMSIEENIGYVADKPIDMDLVNKLDLGKYMGKPLRELSGGTKRRVCLLRALSVPFDILVLDEPFTGLDEAVKIQVIEALMEYSFKKTVIISTHDKYAIEYIGRDKKIVEVK